MPLQHAYATSNLAGSLAAASFTWTPATTTNRAYLNDGRMDKQFAVASTATTINVVIDFGAAVSLTAIALLNSNIASATAGTVTVKGATDAAITTGVVTAKAASTLSTTAPRQKDHVLQFDAVSKRYWQIIWTWTGSFALSIGEIFAASTTALSRYAVYGHSENAEYLTSRFTSYTGETRGHFIAGPYRVKTLTLEDLSESERNELLTMFRATNGGATPILWCHQYEAGTAAAAAAYQDVILGRLESPEMAWNEFDFARYEVDGFTVRSLGRQVGA